MARISGIDLPRNKRVDVALTYIYGIGEATASKIFGELGERVSPSTRVKDLTEDQVGLLNSMISKELKVEGELKREVFQNIKRHMEIKSYRGLRHRRNLPVRGQRTRTNGRTRRGRRKTVGSASKESMVKK